MKMPFRKQKPADVLRERRETTQGEIVKAQLALTAAQAAGHAVVRDGGNADALDRADASVERATRRLATLTGGFQFIDDEIARIERGEAEEADRKIRTETAAAIERVEIAAAFHAKVGHCFQQRNVGVEFMA